jgi:hypothetical protein
MKVVDLNAMPIQFRPFKIAFFLFFKKKVYLGGTLYRTPPGAEPRRVRGQIAPLILFFL